MATPDGSAATNSVAVSDLCKCGHMRHQHWMGLGQPGTCTVTVDKRGLNTGGPELWPCDCKGFVPAGWANV